MLAWTFGALTTISVLSTSLTGVAAVSATCPPERWNLIAAENRPATRYCEKGGYLANPNSIGTPGVSNQNACITQCKEATDPPCQAFGYAPANNTCTLYGKRLIDQKYRSRQTDFGVVYSNMRCYKCAFGLCPAGNAVQNGDFQTADGDSDRQALGWEYQGNLQRICFAGQCWVEYDQGGSTDNPEPPAVLSQQLACMDTGVPYNLDFTIYSDSQGFTVTASLNGDEVGSANTNSGRADGHAVVTSTLTDTDNNTLSFSMTGSPGGFVRVLGVSLSRVDG